MSNQFKIRVAEPVLDGNESKYVLNCLEENWISSRGKYIDAFEGLLAEYCGTKHAIVTNNGTTSLHLALSAMGITDGDEIIMPTLSYVATANAAAYCNATPVFVDSEPDYFSMDPEKIENAITPRTKAIMTVPLYGHPVDMDPIQKIAEKHGLAVVEDSAESLGAEYKGKKVGSLALCSSFSFFGNKTITTGEGGAITTDDEALATRMRYLRGQAVDPTKNYWHKDIGFNYRMTNIAAAIGVAQAERLPIHVERRRLVASWYKDALWSHQSFLQLPKQAEWAKHSYWMYTVMFRDADLSLRDAMIQELVKLGVETRPVFYPIHTMPSHFRNQRYPVSERCSYSGLNLPTHGRMTKADVEIVAESLSKAYAIATQKSYVRRAA
jgi:perosamine synthetase